MSDSGYTSIEVEFDHDDLLWLIQNEYLDVVQVELTKKGRDVLMGQLKEYDDD